MSEINVLIRPTGEIISTRMALYITQLGLQGCTEECIPCHFREVWLRELDQQSVSAVLEEDAVRTERPVPNGETLFLDGLTILPNGIVSEMIRLAYYGQAEFITMYLTLRYPALHLNLTADTVNRVLMEIDQQWTTDSDGRPIVASRHHEPSGHRVGSLPTTPVTPRNGGRPRTSHRTPPPSYSPARLEGHPRQVQAPLALLERQRSPPPYMEQDRVVSVEEFLDHLDNDLILDDELLANLDDILESLHAHAPPPPIRQDPWRTRPGPFDRPGSSTPLRGPTPGTRRPEHPEIAPLGQSPTTSHPTIRPTLVSSPLLERPIQRRRRPAPIITSPTNIPLDAYGYPLRDFQGTEETAFQAEPPSLEENSQLDQDQPRFVMRPSPVDNELDLEEDSQLEQDQPSFIMRPSPFSDVEFPSLSPSNVHPRPTPVDSSETPLLSPSDADEDSFIDSWSSFLRDSDLEMMGDERWPDGFANYQARRREVRTRQRRETLETLETLVGEEEHAFSSPDLDVLNGSVLGKVSNVFQVFNSTSAVRAEPIVLLPSMFTGRGEPLIIMDCTNLV